MAHNNPTQRQPKDQNSASIVFSTVPAVIKRFGPHYERRTSTGLGATQIVLACVSVAAGIMAIVYDAGGYYIGVGIWAAAWYLIAGTIAIAAGKLPTNSRVIATLVFSGFVILFGIAQVIITSFGIVEQVYCHENPFYNNCVTEFLNQFGVAVAANSMMIGVGCLEIFFGSLLTFISGRAIYKGSKAQHPYTIPVTYEATHPETVIIQAPPAVQPQSSL